MNDKLLKIITLAVSFSMFAGCKPTYLKHDVLKSIKEISIKEYGLNPDVEIAGRTINVWLPVKGLYSQLSDQSNSALENIGNIMLVISRVVLSSENQFDFFVTIAYDPSFPQFELKMTRYIGDVKRYILEDISREEFMESLVVSVALKNESSSNEMSIDMNDLSLTFASLLGEQLIKSSTSGQDGKKKDRSGEVDPHEFLSKVAVKYVKRMIKNDKSLNKAFDIADVKAQWGLKSLNISLETVSRPRESDKIPSGVDISKDGLAVASAKALWGAIKNIAARFSRKPAGKTDLLQYSSRKMSRLLRRYNVKGPLNIIIVDQTTGQKSVSLFK